MSVNRFTGAAMYAQKNIVQNAMNSKDHTKKVLMPKQGSGGTWVAFPRSPRGPTRVPVTPAV